MPGTAEQDIHARVADMATRDGCDRDRARVARIDPLCREVRRALELSSGAIAAGLVLGAVPVVSAAPFPAEFELASLRPDGGGDGSAGFVLEGIHDGDTAGWGAASVAGDVNGDGRADVIIGAANADPDGEFSAGESYVVFGTAAGFPAAFELASLLHDNGGDGSAGFVLIGTDAFDRSGYSVSGAGDVNGDGIDDLIIGAKQAALRGRPYAGESYVIFGRNTAQGGNFPAEFQLASLRGGDGSAGFVLTGIRTYDESGNSVRAAGDVNGDGIGDVIVGAAASDPNGRTGAGESYVVFGRDTAQAGNFPAVFPLASLLPSGGGNGSTGFVLTGADAHSYSGASVSGAGDVNGDGIDDVIIGAFHADAAGRTQAGESFVVFGRDTAQAGDFAAIFPLASLLPVAGGNGSAGFVINGIDAYDSSGSSVGAAGDVNGDGIDDLIVGAPAAAPGGDQLAGESYVVFGRDTAQAGNFPAIFALASLLPARGGDGSAGFMLTGIDRNDSSGRSVSGAGDVDGDGIDDLLVGAWAADPGGRRDSGESYVVFGRDTAQAGDFSAVLPLVSLKPGGGGDGSTGFVLNGAASGDFSGWPVSAAGDINDDGIDDLMIGVRAPGRSYAGETYVVFGRAE